MTQRTPSFRGLKIAISSPFRNTGSANSKAWLIAVFSLFSLLLYINSIYGDFLIDDSFLIVDNVFIEGFSNLVDYFTSGTSQFGRPIRLLSLYLDTRIFGKNSVGYHLSNLVYYTVFCILVFTFCDKLFRRRSLAIAATLLFIAHPLHTEGVAYISGRKDVLGGIFSFASFICFVRYVDHENTRDLLLAVLLFLLAIGSKETYAILPLFYVAIEYYYKGRIKIRLFYIGVLLFASLFLLYVLLIRNRPFFDYLHTIPVYGNGQGVNFPTAVKICGLIFGLALFPYRLSADYTFNAVKRIDLMDPSFLLSLAILLLTAWGVYYFRQKNKWMSFGLAWMLLALPPVSQLVPYPEIISERSLIFLSFGTCVFLSSLLMKMPRGITIGFLSLILVAFSARTMSRNLDWRNALSLWAATVDRFPNCARARYNLGVTLIEEKRFDLAEEELRASLIINPEELITVPDYSLDALLNLGNIHLVRGEIDRAETIYTRILRFDEDHPLASRNLQVLQKLKHRAHNENHAIPEMTE